MIGFDIAVTKRSVSLGDVTIAIDETETDKIQEYHLTIYHYLCLKTEEHFLKYKVTLRGAFYETE